MKFRIPDLETLGQAIQMAICDFRFEEIPTLTNVINIQIKKFGLKPLSELILPSGESVEVFFRVIDAEKRKKINVILATIFQREIEGVEIVEMEFDE